MHIEYWILKSSQEWFQGHMQQNTKYYLKKKNKRFTTTLKQVLSVQCSTDEDEGCEMRRKKSKNLKWNHINIQVLLNKQTNKLKEKMQKKKKNGKWENADYETSQISVNNGQTDI